MGEMIKETILGAMISELVVMTDTSMTEFLIKYEELFGKYVDFIKLRQLLEESQPAENWGIICKARDSGTAGSPRTIERVSAGMSFDFEIVLRIFEGDNEKELVDKVKEGLELVEKSYLGGSGSRGSGQVDIKYNITSTQMRDKDHKTV